MYSAEKIREEILELTRFYKLDDSRFINTLTDELLATYVEIVLEKEQFSVVLAGVGREKELISLARANQFSDRVIDAFNSVSARFPGKMVYAKFSLNNDAGGGNMYVLVLEPWEEIFPLLAELSFSKESIEELKTTVSGTGLCFFLAFTMDKATNTLVAKPYHLFDRQMSEQLVKPFLTCYRLSGNGIGNYRKHYTAKVSWPQLNMDQRWSEINDFAASIYKDNYGMLSGISTEGHQKIYIFRFDSRENEQFSNKTYNFYIAEGFKFIQLGNYSQARKSFANAIDYDSGDANAYNGLALSNILNARYSEGIKFAIQAKKLNPKISNSIWFNPVPLNTDETIRNTNLDVQQNGTSQAYNMRGIAYFQNKDFEHAIEDFTRSIEIDPLNAHARNNLGGAFLKVGRFSEAVKTCNIAISLLPAVGNMNLLVGMQAIGFIKELDREPTAKAFNDLGIHYYLLDMYEEAAEHFRKAEAFPVESLDLR